MAMGEPLFKPESLRNLAKDNGPEYAGRSRRALRWCADVIEAADAVVQESTKVRKDDEALIRQILEALEDAQADSEEVLGHYRQLYSERYRPHRLHAQEDVVTKGQAAITAARARLEKAP